MGKSRLEAFSDGVIAIIITIKDLELKVPHVADFDSLIPLAPVFVSYALSFIYVEIYWNKLQQANHPHLSSLIIWRFQHQFDPLSPLTSAISGFQAPRKRFH